jgi:membrane-associated phospholipid phosphatase
VNKRISIIIFLYSISAIFAQNRVDFKKPFDNSFPRIIETDVSKFSSTVISILQSPFTFDKTDWNMTATITAITLASFSVDSRLRNDMFSTKSKYLDNVTYYGEKFGRPIYAGILSGVLYSGGLIFRDSYTKETGQILAEALILNGIFTIGLKAIFGRARPFTNDGLSDISFLEFEFATNENSLPSGHTSTAFTVATVLSERVNNIYASVIFYSLASLTAYQRVYSDVHWFSDTLLGAILGTFVGLKVVKLYEGNKPIEKGYNINIFPKVTPTNYEVGFSFQF